DTSFPSLKNDLSVAKVIKEESDAIKTTVVGPPASQYTEGILKSGSIDYVARWEYDFTLQELARLLEESGNVADVAGISYLRDGRVVHNPDRVLSASADLDRIPFVSKIYQEHLHIDDYFLGQSLYPEVQIFTGRGCPNQCTFCAWPQTLMGRRYRVRSIPNVLDEVEWIEENLRVKEIFFEDDTFTIDRKRVLEFCAAYRERGLTTAWSCNARANTLDYPTIQAMKSANCRLLIAGFESGSDAILRSIKKGITTDQIRHFSADARRAGMMVHGDFIVGLPGETKETIEATKRLIWEIRPDILQVAVATPFPGTEFYTWCKENGHLQVENVDDYLDGFGHQKAIISYPDLTNDEMEREVDDILHAYYFSLSYVPTVLHQLRQRSALDELRRLAYSVRMFLRYMGERRQ
ncbi:MAG TPA: radical SAM protein, partial [Methanomicrobiales archaeon]|nr:radical SAM protein [Methanomicrobiales archaeon]